MERGAVANATGDYKAFGTEKRPEMLDIRYSDEGYLFDYMLVRTVRYSFKAAHCITVYTTAGRIVIKGRNLEELHDGFARRSVAYVREFDPLQHAPVAEDAPCIESIDFLAGDEKRKAAKVGAAAPAHSPD